MRNFSLTDLGLQKLKWNGSTTTYWDDKLPAFGIRVGKNLKTFIIIQGADRRVTTIGHYPEQSLLEARKTARQILASNDSPSVRYPYGKTYREFLVNASTRLKKDTVSQYRYYLESLDFQKDIADITKADITAGLAQFSHTPWAQNYCYAALRSFLNWCLEQEYIDRHPIIRGRPPNKTKFRTRVLSDEELGKVWRRTEDDTYGRMMRLLLLTGQRRIEVRNLKPENVVDGLITFHVKGDKINVIPVTPLVKENLILPFKFNNWTNAKGRFDQECGVDFCHHDLRRTLATKLAGMGVDVVVIERILGHTVDYHPTLTQYYH